MVPPRPQHETEANAHSLSSPERVTAPPPARRSQTCAEPGGVQTFEAVAMSYFVQASAQQQTLVYQGRQLYSQGARRCPMVLGPRRSNDVMRAGLIFGIGCGANSPTWGTSVRSSHVREGTRYDPRTQVRTDPRHASRHAPFHLESEPLGRISLQS